MAWWNGSEIIFPVYNYKDLILDFIELKQVIKVISFLIKTHKLDQEIKLNFAAF